MVKADIDDKASLVKVLAGAYGCFGVTNFWEHMNKEKETQQVRRYSEQGILILNQVVSPSSFPLNTSLVIYHLH